ncbi:MAG: DUF4831 family protein [Bacteroidales bacterium]
MNTIKKSLLVAALLFAALSVNAQILTSGESVPQGAIIYSLPSTTISFKVTASHESFVAGPYAQFSQKYLGIDARKTSGDTYIIDAIEMLPYVETDPAVSVAINLGSSKTASANFINFCSQGLIVTSDSYTGKPAAWRFPSVANNSEFNNSGVSSNLANRSTTLYKNVKTADGLEKVSVQQAQVVEKSLEKKAEETANTIFKLRQKRVDIITGDTDATYSGEAMGSILGEISKLEQEYLSLFIGKSIVDEQTSVFDVIPTASNAKQMYIAFRFSDNQGLLSANNVAGRPIVLELVAVGEKIAPTPFSEAQASSKGKVIYRKPVTVLAKLIDGQKVIMESRVPVYQFGKILTFPIDIAIK